MKFTLAFLTILGLSLPAFSQNYMKGYIIKNDGIKTECMIDNLEWNDNPHKIDYTIDNQNFTGDINDIKAFEIYNFAKFERHTVRISKPKQNVEKDQSYNWEKETVFLKLMIDGEPSLYSIQEGFAPVYFYKTLTDTAPIQLKYRQSEYNSVIQRDYAFRNQINFLCGTHCSDAARLVSKLNYNKSDLEMIFDKINKCHNSHYQVYENKKAFLVPHLEITPGIAYNWFNMGNNYISAYDYSGSKASFRIGASLEIHASEFLRNCNIVIEPYFQSYNGSKQTDNFYVVKADFKSINLNIGLRQYFKANKKITLFVNAFYNLQSFYFNSGIEYFYKYAYSQTEVKTNEFSPSSNLGNFLIGGGVKMGKFGAEARYTIPSDVLAHYDNWHSTYTGFQLIGSFRIF